MTNAIASAFIHASGRPTMSPAASSGPRFPVSSRSKSRRRLGYDSAKTDRQTDDWIVGDQSPIELTTSYLSILQRRSRDLARNAPAFIAGIQAIVDMVVDGESGVRVQPKVRRRGEVDLDMEVNAALRDLWADMITGVDVDARESLAMFLRLVVREWVEVGEAFVVREHDNDESRALPIFWKVVPAERVDHTLNQAAGVDAEGKRKNRITNGIEFDANGRRVAYWITKTDDGGLPTVRDLHDRVPAELVNHVFHRSRSGQERGLPWLYGATILCHDLDDLIDDELTSAHVATMLTAFIRRSEPGVFGSDQERDPTTDQPVARFQAGAVFDLGNDEEVDTIDPNRPGGNFVPFASFILRCIAKTLGISFERISGDYSKTNFASGRLAHLAERETVRRIQYDLIQLFVRPAWRSFVRTAVALGKVAGVTARDLLDDGARLLRARFIPKGFEHHDVLKEAVAAGVRLSLSTTTLERELDERGEDLDDVLLQRAIELEKMRRLGIPVTVIGGAQVVGGLGDGTPGGSVIDAPDDAPDPRPGDDEGEQGMSIASALAILRGVELEPNTESARRRGGVEVKG